jgi:hypothetical protein
MARITIAQLQAQIAQLQAELAQARAQSDSARLQLLTLSSSAELQAERAQAPAKAATPSKVYPIVTRYTDRMGRVWEKTQYSPNRSSSKLVADPNQPPAWESAGEGAFPADHDRMIMEEQAVPDAEYDDLLAAEQEKAMIPVMDDDDLPF